MPLNAQLGSKLGKISVLVGRIKTSLEIPSNDWITTTMFVGSLLNPEPTLP